MIIPDKNQTTLKCSKKIVKRLIKTVCIECGIDILRYVTQNTACDILHAKPVEK